MAEHRSEACVPADHPSLPGHFPGRPVVPGVVLLQLVTTAARAWRGADFAPGGFPAVKFLSPLLPGETFAIHLEEHGSGLRFSCSCGARLLAQGSMTALAEPPA